LALGYEDLKDHDELRFDPLLAAAIGKSDPKGAKRARQRDQGASLAGKSTLDRVELSRPSDAERNRYRRIVVREDLVDQVFLDVFLQAYPKPPKQITLDLDATDDPLHGKQEGRFFHGYYGHYCYLPLYIFCGDYLLCARLRRADIDASAGTVAELQRIVAHIRQSWPKVEILVRADRASAAKRSWVGARTTPWTTSSASRATLGSKAKSLNDCARRSGAARRSASQCASRRVRLPHDRHVEPRGALSRRPSTCRDAATRASS
jgi:hypothetical protein